MGGGRSGRGDWEAMWMLMTLLGRMQCVEQRAGTVIVETAILLGPEWDTDKKAVISQQSRRLKLHDKDWNVETNLAVVSAGLQEFLLSKRTM